MINTACRHLRKTSVKACMEMVSPSFRMGAARTYLNVGLILPFTPLKSFGRGATDELSVSLVLRVALSSKHRTTKTLDAVLSSMWNRVVPTFSADSYGSQKYL